MRFLFFTMCYVIIFILSNANGESYFSWVKRCRNDPICLATFNSVKKRCRLSKNECTVKENAPKCAEDIAILRRDYSAEKCHCRSRDLSTSQKAEKCAKFHNVINANPCYDLGMQIKEEAARLAATTKKAAVSNDIATTKTTTLAENIDIENLVTNVFTTTTIATSQSRDVTASTIDPIVLAAEIANVEDLFDPSNDVRIQVNEDYVTDKELDDVIEKEIEVTETAPTTSTDADYDVTEYNPIEDQDNYFEVIVVEARPLIQENSPEQIEGEHTVEIILVTGGIVLALTIIIATLILIKKKPEYMPVKMLSSKFLPKQKNPEQV